MAEHDSNIIMEFQGVTKTFPGVKALDNVSFQVREGEIHALMGANGAGKSTLIKIIAGMYHMDEGIIRIAGKDYTDLKNGAFSQSLGVRVVFQELNILPDLTVTENIFINNELTKGPFYKWKEMQEKTEQIIKQFGLDFHATDKVVSLSIAQQQMVEILRAVSFGAKIIILDEPTSSLSNKETELLFDTMRKLKAQGVTQIYVSHRLDEIYNNCDRITLLRDGKWILTRDLSDFPREELIRNMIGRKLDEEFPVRNVSIGEEVLRIDNFSDKKYFHNISFSVRKGEVLGIAGLVGAGRTELAKSIFGEFPRETGTIYLHGKQVNFGNSEAALAHGVAYATEDRKKEGLMLNLNLKENITISSLKQVVSRGLLQHKKEKELANKYMQALQVKANSIEEKAISLSGGNQQKVCLAKWLMTKPEVLILDEPTRGIDVGAKAEFYRIIGDLAQQGVAVIVISSEEPELIGLCDRIIVMCNGELSGEITEVPGCDEQLMTYMLGQ